MTQWCAHIWAQWPAPNGLIMLPSCVMVTEGPFGCHTGRHHWSLLLYNFGRDFLSLSRHIAGYVTFPIFPSKSRSVEAFAKPLLPGFHWLLSQITQFVSTLLQVLLPACRKRSWVVGYLPNTFLNAWWWRLAARGCLGGLVAKGWN